MATQVSAKRSSSARTSGRSGGLSPRRTIKPPRAAAGSVADGTAANDSSARPRRRRTSAKRAGRASARRATPRPAVVRKPRPSRAEQRRRLVSAAKLAANRANAAFSTGPRTEAGRDVSRLNALQHGLSAQSPLLPGDNPAEHAEIVQHFQTKYGNLPPADQSLVSRMVVLEMRLRRLGRTEQVLCDMDYSDAMAAYNHRRDTSRGDPMRKTLHRHDHPPEQRQVTEMYALEMRAQSADAKKNGPMMTTWLWQERIGAEMERLHRALQRSIEQRRKGGDGEPGPTKPDPRLAAMIADPPPPVGTLTPEQRQARDAARKIADEKVEEYWQEIDREMQAFMEQLLATQPDPAKAAALRKLAQSRLAEMGVKVSAEPPASKPAPAADVAPAARRSPDARTSPLAHLLSGLPNANGGKPAKPAARPDAVRTAAERSAPPVPGIAAPGSLVTDREAMFRRRIELARQENARLDAATRRRWEELEREEQFRQTDPAMIAEREMLLQSARLTPQVAPAACAPSAQKPPVAGSAAKSVTPLKAMTPAGPSAPAAGSRNEPKPAQP